MITPVRKNIKGNLRAAIQPEGQLVEGPLFYVPDKTFVAFNFGEPLP